MMRHADGGCCAQGVCWFGDDVYAKHDLNVLAHWAQILPFMMLFQFCDGVDMQTVVQVSLIATSVRGYARHAILWVHTRMLPMH